MEGLEDRTHNLDTKVNDIRQLLHSIQDTINNNHQEMTNVISSSTSTTDPSNIFHKATSTPLTSSTTKDQLEKRNSWDQKLVSIISALTTNYRQPTQTVGPGYNNEAYSTPSYSSIERREQFGVDRSPFFPGYGPGEGPGRFNPNTNNGSYSVSTLPARGASVSSPRRFQTAEDERYQEYLAPRRQYHSDHDLLHYSVPLKDDQPAFHQTEQHQQSADKASTSRLHNRTSKDARHRHHQQLQHPKQHQYREGWFS